MFESEALKSLGAFPIIQAAVAFVVIFAGIWLLRRGEKDAKASEPVPQWIMMGPMHDMMQSVHNISEESRRQTELLDKINDSMLACKVALEMIRNESRLR
jgi:hypothetical protein